VATSLYKDQLLKHFRKPYNKGGLKEADFKQRGSNPRCGDELEIGVFFNENEIDQVRFAGRGCSICIASASMMMEAVEGLDSEEMKCLCHTVTDWFADGDHEQPKGLPEALLPLIDVHGHSARKKCVVLGWEALDGALNSMADAVVSREG